MDRLDEKYFLPTSIVDSDHKDVIGYANEAVKGCGDDPVAKAVRLYYAVRDDIWYDPYYPFYLPGTLSSEQRAQKRPRILCL